MAANQPSEAKTSLEKALEHQLQRDTVLTSCVGQPLITVMCFVFRPTPNDSITNASDVHAADQVEVPGEGDVRGRVEHAVRDNVCRK